MGYMRHHAIVVSSEDEEALQKAHDLATQIFRWVSPISPPVTNNNRAFFIPPDGSKEGWQESDDGDARREKFTQGLAASFVDWVEVQYGDENGWNRALKASGGVDQ